MSPQNFIEIIVLHAKREKNADPSSTKNKDRTRKIVEQRIYWKSNKLFRPIFHISNRYHSQKRQINQIALDSKLLNKAIHKNKYQMPIIDSLIQTISQTLSNATQQTAYLTTLDLQVRL